MTLTPQQHSYLSPVESTEQRYRPGAFKKGEIKEVYYPPSVLMVVGGKCPCMLKLKQGLENKGCQVYWIDRSFNPLEKIRLAYFDLIVLDFTLLDGSAREVYQKLEGCPELGNIPTVILTAYKDVQENLNSLQKGQVYLFNTPMPLDTTYIEAELWHLIEQISYLTNRYS